MCLKRFITSKFLVMVIVGMAAAFACSLSAFASDNIAPVISPSIVYVDLGDRYQVYLNTEAGYSSIIWQRRYRNINEDFSSWNDWYTNRESLDVVKTNNTNIEIRCIVYYDSNSYYSNVASVYTNGTSELSFSFLNFGNQVLEFLISSFNIILPWCLAHPIVFVGLALTLVIAAIGTLRHIVGGSHAEKASCDIDCSY